MQIKMASSYKQKQKLMVINDSIPADITVPSNGITTLLSAKKVFLYSYY